jgi:hypothetical protein
LKGDFENVIKIAGMMKTLDYLEVFEAFDIIRNQKTDVNVSPLTILLEKWISNQYCDFIYTHNYDQRRIKRLANKLSKIGWSMNLLETLFEKQKFSRKAQDLTRFVDFWEENKYSEEYIKSVCYEQADPENFLENLTMNMQVPLIIGKLEECISEEDDSGPLLTEISCLFKKVMRFNNWKIEEILELEDSLVKHKKFYDSSTKYLKDVYRFLMNWVKYKIDYSSLKNLLVKYRETELTIEEFWEKMRKRGVNKMFTIPDYLSVSELIRKLSILNEDNEDVKKYVEKKLAEDYEKVMSIKISKISSTNKDKQPTRPIEEWNKSDIQEWSKSNKHLSKKPKLIYETIAVISRAVELINRFKPRVIQILIILIMCNCSEKQKILCQINTGEGKTLIIAMLAIIKSLKGSKVDIVTSAPQLAKTDCDEMKELYSYFIRKVDHNWDLWENSCVYNSDIVYGTIQNFQGDYLRNINSSKSGRINRAFEDIIVDEVDCMWIDTARNSTMISSTIHGLECFIPLFCNAWDYMILLESNFTEEKINGELYWTMTPSKVKDKKDLVIEFYDGKAVVLNIKDKREFIVNSLEKYIESELKLSQNLDEVIPNVEGFTEEELKQKEEIDQRNVEILQIPAGFFKYGMLVKKKWAESAFKAFYCLKEGIDYIVEESIHNPKTIISIDNHNTGIVLINLLFTIWNVLHEIFTHQYFR